MQIRKTFFKSSLSLFSAFLFFSVISSPCQAFLVVPTSAPQARRNLVNIAYNSDKDEFLVVWRDKRNEADNLWDQVTDYGYETDGDIYGRIVKADGTMVTDEFVIIADRSIDEAHPYAVYNSIKKEFVVFVQKMDKRIISKYDIHTTYCYNITAYRISSAGVRLGGEHIVSEAMGCQWYPRVVYNPDKNTFLVAYHDFRNFANYEKAIFARIVGYDTSGNLTNISDDFFLTRTIGNTTTEAYNYQQYSHVAYNSNLKQFFAVWGDDRKNPYITAWNHSYDIFGQILNSDGSFLGENKEIYSAPLNQHFPAIAFNNFTNQYLLTFLSDASQSADGNEVYFGPGYFVRLDQNGNLISQPVKVEETNEIFNPNIDCSNNGSCLVAWSTSWNKGNKVMGRKITKTGILGKVIDLTDNISYPESSPWIAYRSNPINGGTSGYLIIYDATQLGSYSNINALFVDDQEEILPTPTPTVINIITEVGGIGQAHALWEGSPYTANSSVKTGYSASAPYDLSTGDVWAAVEPNEGVYNFSQQRKDVDLAKKYHKKIWLQIQTSANQNKEFNVPKWAREKGVETVGTNCGNGKTRIKYDLIKDLLKDPNYYDPNEYYIDRDTVYVTIKIAAVWDPKYRYYFTNLLKALKKEFQEELDSGIIEAIGFMSGGNFGELTFSAEKPYWVSPTPPPMDAIDPDCPVVQSMAGVFNKPVTEITARSWCNTKYNYKTRSFEEVKICDPKIDVCPAEVDSNCYVSDDYFIQSVMDLMTSYLEIFEKTPIVFQDGAGITGMKRASKVIKQWANTNFGSRVWFKFNGWGPQNSYFQNSNFNEFGNTTRHGYEPGEPYYFSRDNWRSSCAVDSNNKPICTLPNQTNNNCAANSNPPCCTAEQLKPCDDKGKQAISQTVEKGISGDRSSFLVMQSVFYNPAIERGNGIKSNEYYFNPEDTAVASVCNNSEIANWCPGYLNYIFSSQTAQPFPVINFIKQPFNLKKGANVLFNPLVGVSQIYNNCVKSNKTLDHFWKTSSLDSGLFDHNFMYKNYISCY